jgi:hypothetical protein
MALQTIITLAGGEKKTCAAVSHEDPSEQNKFTGENLFGESVRQDNNCGLDFIIVLRQSYYRAHLRRWEHSAFDKQVDKRKLRTRSVFCAS